jgi:hypothetical protein
MFGCGRARIGVYEHNFGFRDIDGPEERAFFEALNDALMKADRSN